MRNDEWSPHLPPAASAISNKEFKTFWAIALHADAKTHRCHPSLETLAELIGIHRSNVVRNIATLVEHGFIKKVGYHGRARVYEVTLRAGGTSRVDATSRTDAQGDVTHVRAKSDSTLRAGAHDVTRTRVTNTPLIPHEEEEKKRKENSPFGIEFVESVVKAYQTICEDLPQMQDVMGTAAGKTVISQIKARSKEYKLSEADWGKYFERVMKAPHLRGENDRGWTATLQWLVKPTNFAKVDQGTYDVRDGKKPKPPRERHDDLYIE